MAAAHLEMWLGKGDAIMLGHEVVSLPALQALPSCWLPCWSH